MAHENEPDQDRLNKFERILLASPSLRISGQQLWRDFALVFPHRASGPAERMLLLSVLQILEARGSIRLPPRSGKRWDISFDPPVPRSIDLNRDRPLRAATGWRSFPWHPQLSWVARSGNLSAQQVEFLKQVHQGLVRGHFSEPVPIKYRSLQLTGDEKRLAALAVTSLFGEGRLSLDLLGCLADALPLPWEAVGEGSRMVIFENAGPFAVARRVLDQLAPRPYDLIAYGGGRSIVAALAHLKTIRQGISSIHYVGDLDYQGLDIAVSARKRAKDLGLPVLEPAAELHRAMLKAADAFGHPAGWPSSEKDPKDPYRVLRFLDAPVREIVREVLNAGRRIPEEVLGPDELRAAWS